jgi:4-amino-4-deoxy-L-arabinose transferase-like glycosyltransferase
VTQTVSTVPDNHAQSFAARLAWIALILATLYICYFHNLGAIGLVGPDEPRYAWIVRDMAETGDWVTPRLYGKPWFEKPALYYWAAALSFKLFGENEATARLPSAISALLATLAMAWLAWRVYGAETARWLLLLLPTTVGMIGFSHAAAPDMPFAAMLTLAMVLAAKLVGVIPPSGSSLISFTSSRSFTSFFFGFFLGLAVLAKGPAAIILAGGGILLWALFTKRWRDAFRCLHPVGIISFCITALPWYILCARRNPDFFRVFIIEHNFKRYLTPEFQHTRPFWFYIPILLIAFVPWTFLLLWCVGYGTAESWRKKWLSPFVSFLFSWVLVCLAFFTSSQSKLPGYILPAIPAVGLLLARSYVVLPSQARRAFRWLMGVSSTLIFVASLLAMGLWHYFHRSPTKDALIVVGLVLLLFAFANLLLIFRWQVALLCVLPILLMLLMFHAVSHPWLRWDPSGRTLAKELEARQIPAEQIYVGSGTRGMQYSLSFYLHHEIQRWNEEDPKAGYVLFYSRRNCKSLAKSPWTCDSEPVYLEASGWWLHRVHPVAQ